MCINCLSQIGKFVALSIIKLPQEDKDPEPFTLENSSSGIPTEFYTYMVNTEDNKIIMGVESNDCVVDVDDNCDNCSRFTDLKGAIRFSTDSATFLSCSVVADDDKHYLYVYST